jgi:branched-chain amino acid transport system permease protein
MVDSTIVLFLMQDGITNGSVYALLGFALVLVFAVTRVILIPQGEFVTYGALTYAVLAAGKWPGTIWLLQVFALTALVMELWSHRHDLTLRRIGTELIGKLAMPLLALALTALCLATQPPALVQAMLAVLIVAPMGPYLYRIAFQPLAEASVLTLMIAAVGVHLVMLGLGLIFFGPEGLRAPPVSEVAFHLGPLLVRGQSLAVYGATLALILALYVFFEHSLWGKALRATAINRVGARLVGIRTGLSGRLAFALAAAMGALSGVLIVPATTIYYDTGFLLGLKGFVAAIIGGLASYPLTGLAALIVGLVEAFASFSASNYKEIIVFMLILPVLVWRSLATPHVDEDEA